MAALLPATDFFMAKILDFVTPVARFIKRKNKLVVFASVLLVVFFNIIFGNYGVIQRFKMKYENTELKTSIADEIKSQKDMKLRIQLLKTDKRLIEKLAKERYGMVKPGESLYKVQIVEE